MAKVSATAPASGQVTDATPDPESATAPARTTRATRGQSREPQQTQRRSARNTSVESETSPANLVSIAAETDLPTVDEDMDDENHNIDASLDDALADVADGAPSPGRVSAVSGTTAKTTFSMEEISELDTDVMLDSLKNLNSASEELLKMLSSAFTPPQFKSPILDEISTEGTKAYKLYQKRYSAFLLYKSDYISAKQDYIRPHNVSRALFDVGSAESIPLGAMRPDSVLYKANLAHMLHVLLVHARNPAVASFDLVESLEALDQEFPRVVASPTFSPMTFKMSIALTTQLAINRMALFIEDPNFSPQGLAEHAFISDSENDVPMYRHHHSLHLDDLSEEERSLCLDRINGIVTALKGPFDDGSELDSVEALERVRQTWPWTGFIETDLVSYYNERKDELDREVRASGGIENLDSSVKKAVQNRSELKKLAAMTSSLQQTRFASGKSKKQSLSADAVQALRALTPANGPPTQGMAPVAQMTPQMGDNVSNDQFNMSSSMVPPPGSNDMQILSQFQDANQTQRASAGRGRGRGRGKGKANVKSFNDRQSGAQRVEWESQQQAGLVPYETSVLGKRSRDAEEDQANHWEPTQDGGPQDEDEDPAFETRAGDNAAADARRLAAPSVQHARPFLNQPPYFTAPDSPGMQQRSPKRRNPGSSAPHPADYLGSEQHLMDQDPNADPHQAPPSTSKAQEYNQAAWTARQYRILNHHTPARERRVWNDLETEALMTYINEWPEEDNLQYAVLKRKDTTDEGLHALQGRTAEDIRFRARNMKVNFLLSRSQDIHPNWTKVQLARKEIDKLHARGVPYAQNGLRGAPAGMDTGVGGSQSQD